MQFSDFSPELNATWLLKLSSRIKESLRHSSGLHLLWATNRIPSIYPTENLPHIQVFQFSSVCIEFKTLNSLFWKLVFHIVFVRPMTPWNLSSSLFLRLASYDFFIVHLVLRHLLISTTVNNQDSLASPHNIGLSGKIGITEHLLGIQALRVLCCFATLLLNSEAKT